jgi:hypothetical protein
MEPSPPSTANGSGKLLTVLILLIAALAAAVAWWHHMNKGRRALAFWGGQVAYRMRTAESVELWVLASGDEFPARQATFGGRVLPIAKVIDISQAPGLVHARQALISDASFDWEAAAGATKPSWQYAIRFTSAGESSFVLLDLERAWAAEGDDPGRVAKMVIGKGLRAFLEEQIQRHREAAAAITPLCVSWAIFPAAPPRSPHQPAGQIDAHSWRC